MILLRIEFLKEPNLNPNPTKQPASVFNYDKETLFSSKIVAKPSIR